MLSKLAIKLTMVLFIGVLLIGSRMFDQLTTSDSQTILAATLPVTAALTPLNNIKQVAAGDDHTCAVAINGGVYCWGDNSSGQLGDGTTTDRSTPVQVIGLSSGMQTIAAGWYHTCAVTIAGAVYCWGANSSGQLGNGTTVRSLTPVAVTGLNAPVQAIDAGWNYTCALTSIGSVFCWGSNSDGQLGDGTTIAKHTPIAVIGLNDSVQTISAGWGYACAVTTAGAGFCWGSNSSGQLGDGTEINKLTPTPIAALGSTFQRIAAGFFHTCALTQDSGIYCWGSNYSGELGDGTTVDKLTPVAVEGLGSGVQSVAVGNEAYTCALKIDGNVLCWGDNSRGQLGDGTTVDKITPVSVSGASSDIQALATGTWHTCAVTASSGVLCWGNNWRGQLGDNTLGYQTVPAEVTGLASGIQAIAAGGGYEFGSHSCALTTDGDVLCWGQNNTGQLGNGTRESSLTPVAVVGVGSPIKAVATGAYQSCAVTIDGGAFCWGRQRSTPVGIQGLDSDVEAIAAGGEHNCALTTTGSVLCWGSNYLGQLGDGTTSYRAEPVEVIGLENGVQSIATGRTHTCALTTGGGVFCWGDNSYGQLGDGTTVNQRTPVAIAGLNDSVQSIVTGSSYTCALTMTGAVLCWGDNNYEPTVVPGLESGIQSIAAGWDHACAVTTTGGALCWGSNYSGELGDGTTVYRSTPVMVTGLSSGVKVIAGGGYHTCAVTVAGRALCWGDNFDGQLGSGTPWRTLPTQVLINHASNTFAVTLPTNATGTPGSQVTIPVLLPGTVSGLGITAYDFRLTFDPAVLSFVNASTAGTLSDGWNITPNTATPGAVQIVAFNVGDLAGTGTLINLVFNVVGAANSSTALTWSNFVFNEGDPAVQTSNGLFTVRAAWTVAGAVSYRTTTRAVSAVTLDLSGASTAQATTNSNGGYSFTIQTSGAHTVTPSKSGGVNGISAFDAAYVAQCVAAVRNLADCPMLAADASGNNALSAFDAAQVAQYVAGLAGPTSRVGRWLFDPASRTYATLTGDLTTENYGAYLIGEVSGNWQPPAATAAQQTASEQTAAPLTAATAADGTVTLGHTGAVSDLIAYHLTLHYDASAGRLTEVIPAAAVSADAGWELVVNEATPGVVELVGYGVTPVNGGNDLVTLHFQDGAGQATTLVPTVVMVQLNEEPLWTDKKTGTQEEMPPYRQLLPLVVK